MSRDYPIETTDGHGLMDENRKTIGLPSIGLIHRLVGLNAAQKAGHSSVSICVHPWFQNILVHSYG